MRFSRTEKTVVGIGLFAAFFTLASGIMPEITGWHRITCDNEPANPKCIIITREVFEGIPKPMVVSFYFAVAAALSCSFWLFSIRTKNYGRGKDEDRSTTKQNFKLRVAKLYQSLSMKTLMRDRSAGLMHSCLYFGFLGLLLATITLEIDHQLPTSFKFLEGTTYQVYSFLSDLAGVVFLIGCIWAFYRRYIQKVDRLKSKTEREDGFNLALLFSLGVTGFFVEAFRISIFMNQHRPIDFERYSFIGFPLARFLDDLMTANHLAIFHRWTWTIHIGLFLIFLIVLPATKLRHMVTSPINSYLSPSEKPKGSLTPMEDLTTSEQNSFGAGTVEDFTWKQLYDTDACTTCGRCTSVCPANATGKVLDPRRIVLSINEVMTSSGEVVVSPTVTTKQSVNNIKVGTNEITSLVSREEVFACTTCKACDEICPVNIEIMHKIVDIRRYYTLMESSFPSELSNAYRGMENQENPWSISQSERANWTKEVDIEVPIIDPQNKNSFVNEKGNFKFDVLYWVGCAGSFDDRAKKTTKALASLLNRAGISFAILGSNEKCTGDPARRSGNEYIFQMLAMENINNLNEINPTTILTQCPHCFNTLKNEYKDFGGNFNVQHHTQFLLKLIDEEKIKIEDATLNEKITLHDSCYLTRHNDVIEEPRKIIGSIKGIEVIEMNRNKKSNFCCGAGGAQFFMEELGDERVNINRAKESINTGANTIITECPFCSVMLGDGVASIEQDGKHTAVKDLAVLLDESFNDQLNQI